MKAYTAKDKEQIRRQILEAGLDLFHDQGIRSISIRELTKRAGIAQGGFYSFFPNKEALVIELLHYRTSQKMGLFEKTFHRSLENPAAFVGESLFYMSWDLKQKADRKQMYRDVLNLCLLEKPHQRDQLFAILYSTLEHLADYWRNQGLCVTMDVQGLMNVVKGSMILYTNLNQLDSNYSESILRTYYVENCKKYVLCDKTREEEARTNGQKF